MPDATWEQTGGMTRREQEVGPGEYAQQVYATNAVTAAVALQRFFLAGSGRLNLAVAGNIRGLISNPAGSGRSLQIVRLGILTTALSWVEFRINPTTGLPATARAAQNAVLASAQAAVGTVAADTDTTVPVGGGTLLSTVLGVPANSRVSIDLPPFVVSPGVSLGLNIALAGGADVAFSVYWAEE